MKYVFAALMHAFTILAGLLIMTVVGVNLRGDVDISGSVHWSPTEHVYDARLGWKGRPGFKNENHRHAPALYPVDVEINADGFRDRDWSELLERSGSSERILIVGDSFIYGWGSVGQDTFSNIAQELATRAGKTVVFFNGGMSGYGFHHYRRMLELYADRIKPTQVWVMLTPNDVGDTALPYDHRYRQRVYKPFFDGQSELNNATVRRRPSLWLADTVVGAWPGLIALDELVYLLDDLGYRRSGLPSRSSSPLPVAQFDALIWHRPTLDKFPAIERMVRRNIDGMIDDSKRGDFVLKFFNNTFDPTFDRYFSGGESFYDGSEGMLGELWPWLTHVNEGHPNHLWAALLAGRALGMPPHHDAIEWAISKRLGVALMFNRPVDASRALSGFGWGLDSEHRLYLKKNSRGYLKLWIDSEARSRSDLELVLETAHDVPAETIRVHLLHTPCQARNGSQPASKRHRFICENKGLPMPFLGLFAIDVAADVVFEKATLIASRD